MSIRVKSFLKDVGGAVCAGGVEDRVDNVLETLV